MKSIVAEGRAFLNLWFAKPMVCMQVPFHENDGNHENDEDNADSQNQGVKCRIGGNHGNDENDENPGIRGANPRVPQTTGLEIPKKAPSRVLLGHTPSTAGTFLVGVSRGNTIRGNRPESLWEGNLPLRGALKISKNLWKPLKNFWKPLKASENPPSQRPSQRQISHSEALGPVAPNRVAP